jgi:hypothetical protein
MADPTNKTSVTCSFCGKHQDEVRKMVAGPTVYICDECIDLCNDIIAKEDSAEASNPDLQPSIVGSPSVSVLCIVCHLPKPATEVLTVPEAGFVCHPCADAIRAVAEAELPPLSNASTLLTHAGALVEQPCRLCGVVLPPANFLVVGTRGVLCGSCVEAVSDAMRRQGQM